MNDALLAEKRQDGGIKGSQGNVEAGAWLERRSDLAYIPSDHLPAHSAVSLRSRDLPDAAHHLRLAVPLQHGRTVAADDRTVDRFDLVRDIRSSVGVEAGEPPNPEQHLVVRGAGVANKRRGLREHGELLVFRRCADRWAGWLATFGTGG